MSYHREVIYDSYDGEESEETLFDIVRDFVSGSYGGTLQELLLTAFRLIEEGDDLNEVDNEGNSAIFYVIKYRTLWTILPYLAARCDVNVINEKGFTPLHIAAQDSSTFPTLVLYNNHAHIVSDERGHYPVDIARIYGSSDVIAFYE